MNKEYFIYTNKDIYIINIFLFISEEKLYIIWNIWHGKSKKHLTRHNVPFVYVIWYFWLRKSLAVRQDYEYGAPSENWNYHCSYGPEEMLSKHYTIFVNSCLLWLLNFSSDSFNRNIKDMNNDISQL